MKIPKEIASDLLDGHTSYEVTGERIGLRAVKRVWFVLASGHYVADVGSCFMWSDGPNGPWKPVPGTTPCEKQANGPTGDGR